MPWEIVILITHLSGVCCGCACVWAVVSHKTRTDTLTYTYPHTLTRDTAVGEFERPSKLYSMAFHFISLLQATNIICTYSTQSNNNNNDDNQREKEMKRKSALEWVLSI